MTATRMWEETRRLYCEFRYRRGEARVLAGQHAAAHRDFAAAARAGHTESQYRLGQNYNIGRGCMRSGGEALRWFEWAAQSGHVEAQFELGVLLLADRDLAWCTGPSARWAAAAAERGSRLAELAFPGGVTLKKDNAGAYHWLSKAARPANRRRRRIWVGSSSRESGASPTGPARANG